MLTVCASAGALICLIRVVSIAAQQSPSSIFIGVLSRLCVDDRDA